MPGPTHAIKGHGTKIQYMEDASTIIYAGKVKEFQDLTHYAVDDIDVTPYDLAEGSGEEFEPADTYNPGEIVVGHFFKSSDFSSGLPILPSTGQHIIVQIQSPDQAAGGKCWQCDGYVKNINVSRPRKGEVIVSITTKFTGDWNYDATWYTA